MCEACRVRQTSCDTRQSVCFTLGGQDVPFACAREHVRFGAQDQGLCAVNMVGGKQAVRWRSSQREIYRTFAERRQDVCGTKFCERASGRKGFAAKSKARENKKRQTGVLDDLF